MRVLIVDDDEVLLTIVTSLLQEDGYEVTAVTSSEEALSLFSKAPFEIAVFDVQLPGMSGLDALKVVKKQWPDTQVVIMTSYTSVESAIAALRSGAYDYLAKPFDDPAVISAVVGRAAEKTRLSRENARLIQDLQKTMDDIEDANRQLRDMAIRDGLTGLYNHRYLQEFLSLEVERSHRYAHGFSLIFVDVDHFKKYNDTHGHLQGDHLLRAMAAIFRTFFRKTDVIARYGGEEFMILLPETPKQVACRLAEELRRRIEENTFPGREGLPAQRITISIGVAAFPEDGADAATLTKKADTALYLAKGQGRNRICMA